VAISARIASVVSRSATLNMSSIVSAPARALKPPSSLAWRFWRKPSLFGNAVILSAARRALRIKARAPDFV
jgi:hypothetical protein